MQAALEDPDSVLKTEFAGLMAETEALRRSRNRLCHGAWIAFETPVLATVRFFPNGEVLDKAHQQIASLYDLTCTKNRVMDVVGELGTKVEVTPVHDPTVQLWEQIGRAVATFGMLEDLLPRALYIITGYQRVDETEDTNQQVEEWCARLIKSMSDTLGGLALSAVWHSRRFGTLGGLALSAVWHSRRFGTLGGLALSLKAAWKERDGVLQPENAKLVQEIQVLTKLRNRVCHATYQDFMTPDVASARDGPIDPGVDNETREAIAISALQDAKLRVVATIAALRTEVRTRYQSGFPGANDS